MGSAVIVLHFCPLWFAFFFFLILTPNQGITNSLMIISLLFLSAVNISNKLIFLWLNEIRDVQQRFGHGQAGTQNFFPSFSDRFLGSSGALPHSLIPTLGDNSPLTHNGNALTRFFSFWNLSDPPLPLQDCLGEDD